MKLRFLNRELELDGRYLTTELRDANEFLTDRTALRKRMEEDGYLLIRGLHDREAVAAARHEILEKLHERGMLAPDHPIQEGFYNPGYQEPVSTSAMANRELIRSGAFQAVVAGTPVLEFFASFLGGPARSFDFHWLRTVGTGAESSIHYDAVFMNRGTRQLYSCWSPLGDLSLEMGPLVLCLGSHRFEEVKESYGRADVDRDLIAGHFSEDPVEIVDKFGGCWATTNFEMGDVVIFGMHTMHASLPNLSEKLRISVDSRYQLASDPIDERWVGTDPKGHYAWRKAEAEIEPLDVSRARWGV